MRRSAGVSSEGGLCQLVKWGCFSRNMFGGYDYENRATGSLPCSACDRRHQKYLVAILEGVGRAAEEAHVFLIHIDIEEAPRLSCFIPQMWLQVGELRIEFREQFA